MDESSTSEMKKWKDFDFNPAVQSAINEMGFTFMTPVQAACIPLFLHKKKDVAVEAVTGSGKTLAFLVPLLEILLNKECLKKHEIGGIIISPTKELAVQIADVLSVFMKYVPHFSSLLLIGGEHLDAAIKKISQSGANIVIATPGRLSELLSQKQEGFSFAVRVKSLEVLILDEADRLLDMGFESSLNTILSYLPKQRRTGLFSATQTKEVDDIIRAGLRNPVCITVKEKTSVPGLDQRTPSTLKNFYLVASADTKFNILLWFLLSKQTEKHMVFFSTCASVDYFSTILTRLLKFVNVMSIHGKMKKRRHKIFSQFQTANSGVILCTDVMARGVDIPNVDWVIQFDPPSSSSAFVHRCGRTARIGKEGNALLMLLPTEEVYVNFLILNQKVNLEKMETPEVADFIPKVKRMAIKDRDVFEKGLRAFVSFIRFYSKHECNLLFQLKDLDLGQLANGFALLKLPRMPELKHKTLTSFQAVEMDFNEISYRNKTQEMERQKKLDCYKKTGSWPQKNTYVPKKDISWSKTKKLKERKKLKRKKKHVEETAEELEELARDARLVKKLKQRKITKEEFNVLFDDGNPSDSNSS